MRSPTTPLVLTALLLAVLPVAATAQQEDDQAFLRVPVPEEGEDRIHRLRTQVRHTTVIVLPADENILDFVVGDSEYWHLTGAANVAFLKPLRPDAATNIALVCESGRIYSFLVAEQSAEENERPPHLVVRFESGAEKTGLSGGGTGRPAFVARSEVAAYQQMAAEAAVPKGWSETFKTGGEPSGDTSAYPSREEILGALKEQHTRNTEAAKNIDASRFAEPHPDEARRKYFPTLGDQIVFLMTSHEMDHLGQIAAWRRAMGLGSATGV